MDVNFVRDYGTFEDAKKIATMNVSGIITRNVVYEVDEEYSLI